MPRIQQLPPLVASQIAAGEVIERPASVVKELLENAVDAGASRIDVEVEAGGAELIRIVDDGCGISAGDLPLALASHATSKLVCADDLFRIATFGFRGEALASIAAVAQVQLQSRPKEEPLGAEVSCQGGDLSVVRPWNGTPGTRIEVRHLFFNTPVRRKFLKATATEVGHISEAFTRLALAHCRPVVPAGLHLTLRHNNKPVYDVPASATLLDRLGQFFGPEVAGSLYSVEAHQGTAHLHGFIADPACERGTARMQYLFVNGRWVRDRSLGHAVQEAYRGLLMTGRYAVSFLFLEMPPDQVDVNVHPTKVEVRFRDSQALHHLVFAAIRDRLRQENLTARLRVTSSLTATPEDGPSPVLGPEASADASVPRSAPWQLTAPPVPTPVLPFPAQRPQPAPAEQPSPSPLSSTQPVVPTVEAVRAVAPPAGKAIQVNDTYLVVGTEAGLLVVDQHALHERILYEQFKARLRAGSLETQRLLIPEPIDLTAEQAARTLEHRAALEELGLGVEDFGGGTILLTSYPSLFGRRSPQELLRAVVDHLLAKERLPSRDVLFNDLLSLMACHAAVRAGDRLTSEEMNALLDLRELADDTHHCPHGRPTSLLLSRHDLDRQFRRV
jgi:DNA mismatch repair protein MutL